MGKKISCSPTPANLLALRVVASAAEAGGLTLRELAQRLGLRSHLTARRHLVRLVELGLVSTGRARGGRRMASHSMRVTPLGKKFLASAGRGFPYTVT